MIVYGKNEMDYISLKDPVMSDLVEHFGHMDKGLTTDIFASLVLHIIGQMLSDKVSRAISSRLFDRIGTITPDNILILNEDDLRAMGISYKKAEYILQLAKDVKDKVLSFDNLSEMSDEEVIAYLVKIKGVGKWTAEMIAEFTLGRLNIFSYDDVALQNGIKKAHGFKTLSKQRFERMRKKYSPYCSVASLYYYALNDE